MAETRSANCKFITERDHEGKKKYSTKTIANFKMDSPLADVYETAVEIGLLFKHEMESINLVERAELTEE